MVINFFVVSKFFCGEQFVVVNKFFCGDQSKASFCGDELFFFKNGS